MACDSDIRFAVTNPTSITVVTEEDWMMAVTNVPVTSPMRRLVVSLPRIRRIFSPATILRDFSHLVHSEQEQGQSRRRAG